MRDIHPRLGEPEMREEFLDWTEDCLVALRSVTDHLLQEYNEKFILGIGLETRMNFEQFKETAKRKLNKEAMAFVAWLQAEVREIHDDEVLGPLSEQRHFIVHRLDPNLTGNVGVTENIRIADSVHVEVVRANGTVEDLVPEQPTLTSTEKSPTQVQVYWAFDGIPDIDVLEACDLLNSRLEKLVKDAESLFI